MKRYIFFLTLFLLTAETMYAVSQEDAQSMMLMAEVADKKGLYVVALNVYRKILDTHDDAKIIQKAAEKIIDIAQKHKLELLIISSLEELYKKNPQFIETLSAHNKNAAAFMLAKRAFGTKNYPQATTLIKMISRGSKQYPKGQYLAGSIGLLRDNEEHAPLSSNSSEYFMRVVYKPRRNADAELLLVSDQAYLALGRIAYENAFKLVEQSPKRMEKLQEALTYYQKIPRFSEVWHQALLEQGWAHTALSEYGLALGNVRSLDHEYFSKVLMPEKDILEANIYWYNCQWDRVNRALKSIDAEYGEIKAALDKVMQNVKQPQGWIMLMEQPTKGPFPIPPMIVQSLLREKLYQDFSALRFQIAHERAMVEKNTRVLDKNLQSYASQTLIATQKNIDDVYGEWLMKRSQQMAQELDDAIVRARVISLETKTAEAEWLEQGRRVEGKERKLLPRPYIRKDSFVFWWALNNEQYADEIGRLQANIVSECYE